MLLAYLIALVAAVPVGWKRKLFALAGGLTLAYVYMVLMMRVFLLHWFDKYSTLEVLRLEGFAKSAVEIAYPVMVLNPGTLVFVALLIGAVLIIRKGDWNKLTETAS